MTIGEKIRELRRAKNISQKELASSLGITCQAISKWEHGVSSPDLSLIAPLTRLLNVSADELLGITDSESDKKRRRFDAARLAYRMSDDNIGSYLAAQEAADEFPTEVRYLEWLASAEYALALDESRKKNANREYIDKLTADSLGRYDRIIENCTDEMIVKNAEKGRTAVLRLIGSAQKL